MINTDPNHVHTYDAQGRMTCCTLEEKVYSKAGADNLLHEIKTDDSKSIQRTKITERSIIKQYLPAIISFVILLIGIASDNYFKPAFFTGYIRLAWYAIAYLPVGLPVIKEAWEAILKKEFFTEFTLMILATLGAFAIGQYPEGVAVMYSMPLVSCFKVQQLTKQKATSKHCLT